MMKRIAHFSIKFTTTSSFQFAGILFIISALVFPIHNIFLLNFPITRDKLFTYVLIITFLHLVLCSSGYFFVAKAFAKYVGNLSGNEEKLLIKGLRYLALIAASLSFFLHVSAILGTFYSKSDCWELMIPIYILNFLLIISLFSFGILSMVYTTKLETKNNFPKYCFLTLTILYLFLEAFKSILVGYSYPYFRIGFPIEKDIIHPTAFVLLFTIYPLLLLFYGITNLLLSRNFTIKNEPRSSITSEKEKKNEEEVK